MNKFIEIIVSLLAKYTKREIVNRASSIRTVNIFTVRKVDLLQGLLVSSFRASPSLGR